MVYRVIHGQAPEYLHDLLSIRTSSRSLRSSDHVFLMVPKSHLKTYGDNSFSVAGPKLWNGLPLAVKAAKSTEQFKSNLKAHLFKHAF